MSAVTLTPGLARAGVKKKPTRRPKVAAIFTSFYHRSHAHVILENFLEPYYFNGERTEPNCDVVSFFPDQIPRNDMARDAARKYKIPIYNSIEEALCLGGKKLAVDAILSIAEHGDYPKSEFGQIMYPHKRFFDECVAVMKRSGRFVPLFNDKMLSHSWEEAQEMVDVSRKLGIPLMAGSSVPLAERRPPLEMDPDAEIEEALAIHAGPAEVYDFHALEWLESLIETRKGGKTGVSSVEFIRGADAVAKAARQGRWSMDLARAAMEAETGQKRNPLVPIGGENPHEPTCALVTYQDGVKGVILRAASWCDTRANFACRLKGKSEPLVTHFYGGPWHNRNLFKALCHAIQHHFITGEAPYPVERTLRVSGTLDAAMQSRTQGKLIHTPHLEFTYPTRDYRAMREMGATWKIITEDIPPTQGIDSADLHPKRGR